MNGRQTRTGRASRTGTWLALLIGCVSAMSAMSAPPVEEELPGGRSGVSRALRALANVIVIEGEVVDAKASRGEIRIEEMAAPGTALSGNRQLRWSAPGEGAMLLVSPDVPAGRYEVTLHLTQGPACARIEVIGTEGVIPRSDVELYGATWSAPAQVALGVLDLGPERGFAIRILGRDPRATGYVVGLDRISLVKSGERMRPQSDVRRAP